MKQHNFIKTPAQSTSSYLGYAEALRDKQNITFGCVMDNYVIPPHPGDVVAFVARPGHGKTAMMSYMARRVANQIVAEGKQETEIVLYVSWEQITEEIEVNLQAGEGYTVSDIAWGKADMETVRKKAFGRPNLPLWVAGKSIEDANQRTPPMTFDVIFDNIQGIKQEFGVVPRLICFDYLQIIPVPGMKTRDQEVSEAMYMTKQLAIDVACPILIGVQAKAAVEGKQSKIPVMGDAYYSSAVEHVVDKGFGLLKPIKYHDPGGKPVALNGRQYEITDTLYFVEMWKQRMEQGSRKMAFNFDMSTMRVWDFIE